MPTLRRPLPLLLALIALLGACGGQSAEAPLVPERIAEPEQGLSLVPPAGFRRILTRLRGQSYPAFVAEDRDGNAPSLTVILDPTPLASGETLEAFVERNRSALQGHLRGYVEVSKAAFTTRTGEPAWKLATRSVEFGQPFVRNYYFLLGPRGGYVINTTQAVEDARELEADFDACVGSIEFLAPTAPSEPKDPPAATDPAPGAALGDGALGSTPQTPEGTGPAADAGANTPAEAPLGSR
jgi:hypothetical protein